MDFNKWTARGDEIMFTKWTRALGKKEIKQKKAEKWTQRRQGWQSKTKLRSSGPGSEWHDSTPTPGVTLQVTVMICHLSTSKMSYITRTAVLWDVTLCYSEVAPVTAGFFHDLLFDPEAGDDTLLRNVWISPKNVALKPRRLHRHSRENHKFKNSENVSVM